MHPVPQRLGVSYGSVADPSKLVQLDRSVSENLSARGWVMAVLLFAVLMIDGIDMQLLALVAPLVIKDFGVSAAAFGPALASASVGMAIGALSGGNLGDRLGQKRVLVAAALIFGLTTIIGGLVNDLALLSTVRFLSGLGFGTIAPTAVALAMDWVPARHRTTVVVLLSVGVPFGGLVGAQITSLVLPSLGWRGSFALFGAMTLALALLMRGFLPESLTFLCRTGRLDRARSLFRAMFGAELPERLAPVEIPLASPGKDRDKVSLKGHWPFALRCGIAYFAEGVASFAVVGWATIYMVNKGITLPEVHAAISVRHMMAVGAALSGSILIARFGATHVLLTAQVFLLLAIVALAMCLAPLHGPPDRGELLIVQGAAGLAGGAAGLLVTGLYAVMANGFPAAVRATGTGFGMMLGRTGAIAILLTGGMLIALDPDRLLPYFSVVAVTLLAAIVTTMGIARRGLPDESCR